MAKHKIIDYIDFPLDTIFDEYENINIKVIHSETGIPMWQLKELEELGYIREGHVIQEGSLILKIMMYCMNNRRFIKSAVGRISYRDRAAMYESIQSGHNKLLKWIYTRVYNLKDIGQKVIVKDIYNELCQHFPKIEEQGNKGFKDIKRYIKSAGRKYRKEKELKIEKRIKW